MNEWKNELNDWMNEWKWVNLISEMNEMNEMNE